MQSFANCTKRGSHDKLRADHVFIVAQLRSEFHSRTDFPRSIALTPLDPDVINPCVRDLDWFEEPHKLATWLFGVGKRIVVAILVHDSFDSHDTSEVRLQTVRVYRE